MAFKGLRFAGLEWKNITASKVMWVVIAAIAIMPLLYGALYLAAFQDPYARLNTVPVAVVNEDKGAVIASESRNLGNDVVDELKDTDDGLQWNFVSAEEAQRGLEDGAYFMTCTIPADFSQSVASVDSSAPEKAQLKIDYNQSENMLASQIGETVWKEVRTRVSDTIATEYWTTVLGRVADSGKDIQTAADGAATLGDGLVTATDGSQTITANLGTLKDGATSLESGLGTLQSGTFTLRQGTLSLVSGANDLKSGTSQVASGASTVASGAAQLQTEGTSALASGASELANKTAGLDTQAGQLNDGVQTVVGSMSDLVVVLGSDGDPQTLIGGSAALAGGLESLADQQTGAPALAAGMGALSGSLSSLQGGAVAASTSLQGVDQAAILNSDMSAEDKQALLTAIGTAQAYLDGAGGQMGVVDGLAEAKTQTDNALLPGAQKIADSAPTLLAGAQSLNGGLVQMRDSLTSKSSDLQALSAGASQLAQAAPSLVGGIDRLDAGAREVNANMTDLASGASQVASGASQVDAGASSAVAGANQLNDGATQLADGATSAKDGSAQIASGATQLQEGSATLTSGLHDAVDGSDELATKLGEGAVTAAEQTTNIDGKSGVMSDPVELVNEYYTTVKNYGTGFAPYFMALGLWVGGLVAGFVFKPLNNRLIMSGGNPIMVAFSNYMPVAFFSLIQATLLMVVLQFGLQLQIDNVPAFYAMGYLTSLVFAAIMQVLMAAFGFPGKFVAIILLMLQLTACAGTFPIQTTPDFFQVINPYMPMTYVVQGMRQIMAGMNYSIVVFDCLVLFAIGAVCFALTCLVAYRKRTVRMDDLHPVLQLG